MIWKEWGSFLLLRLIMVVLLSPPSLAGFPLESYKNDVKSQKHELLKGGITPDETEKALDILLKLRLVFSQRIT